MSRLVDVKPKRRPRWKGSRELTVLPDRCLRCLRPLEELAGWEQLTLFRHGGYGGITRESRRGCRHCGTVRSESVTTASPLM